MSDHLPPCTECNHPMRRSNEPPTPGVRRHHHGGICDTCNMRRYRGTNIEPPTPTTPPGDWIFEAACTDSTPDAWFPELGESTKAAKEICHTCPVINECLEYALANSERWGVWGGLATGERAALKKARRQQGAA